jgi:hypothetical protein
LRGLVAGSFTAETSAGCSASDFFRAGKMDLILSRNGFIIKVNKF